MDFETAVERLTQSWVDILKPEENPEGKFLARDRKPLLVILRERVGSSLGRGSGGGSGHGAVPIDLGAFTLLEMIDSATDAWNLELGHLATGSLESRVKQLGERIVVAWKTGDLDEARFHHLQGMVVGWADQILASLEGWHVMDLLAECPECHETWVSDPRDRETRRHCLQVHFRDGAAGAWAECARCQHRWEDVKELAELGFSIGAQADPDTLREIGVAAM